MASYGKRETGTAPTASPVRLGRGRTREDVSFPGGPSRAELPGALPDRIDARGVGHRAWPDGSGRHPPLPVEAPRQALANALVHRDYAIGGGSVGVALLDDRLEIVQIAVPWLSPRPQHGFVLDLSSALARQVAGRQPGVGQLSVGVGSPFGKRGFLTTRPDRRHDVQTFRCVARPSTTARTLCRFGCQTRRLALLAWLRRLPNWIPLLQISQTRDIDSSWVKTKAETIDPGGSWQAGFPFFSLRSPRGL